MIEQKSRCNKMKTRKIIKKTGSFISKYFYRICNFAFKKSTDIL